MAANDPFGLTASGIPPELQAQYRGLTREQAIQEALLQQSQQPLGGVIDAGMFKVARSPWEGIAKIAQAYSARKGLDRTDERMGELGGRAAQMTADEVRRYQMAKSGAPGSSEQIVDETANGGEGAPATITAPAVAGNPRGAIDAFQMSRNPVIQALINRDETRLNRVEDLTMADRRARELQDNLLADRAAGRDQIEATRRDLAADSDKRTRDLAADADKRAREMQQFIVANRPSSQGGKAPVGFRFTSDGESLEPIPGGPKDPGAVKLPTQALKLQQAEVDAIGTAAAIKADLGKVLEQLSPSVDPKTGAIKPPALALSLVNNAVGSARNYIGMSNENSRNLGSFKATLEKLRNDSLRLNKGVQTEGDAVRAWNEILANPNDQEFVKKRLAEVQEINDRAIDLRKMNVDNIRRNYGAPPLDTSGQEVVRPAIGIPPASPKGSGGVPAGVDPNVWAVMTPQEKALFK